MLWGEWEGPGIDWGGAPGNLLGREFAEWYGVWVTQRFASVKEQLRFVLFNVSKFITIPDKDLYKKLMEGRRRNE